MIHIKYQLRESPIHGIGLFAAEAIDARRRIYTPNKLLDVNLTTDEYFQLSKREQEDVQYYGYFNKYSGAWHVAFDPIRFLNHGDEGIANVTQDEAMVMTAVRDIIKGEELLQDYTEIYPPDSTHYERIKGSTVSF